MGTKEKVHQKIHGYFSCKKTPPSFVLIEDGRTKERWNDGTKLLAVGC